MNNVSVESKWMIFVQISPIASILNLCYIWSLIVILLLKGICGKLLDWSCCQEHLHAKVSGPSLVGVKLWIQIVIQFSALDLQYNLRKSIVIRCSTFFDYPLYWYATLHRFALWAMPGLFSPWCYDGNIPQLAQWLLPAKVRQIHLESFDKFT